MNRPPEPRSRATFQLATLAVLSALLLAACGPSPSVSVQVSDSNLPVLLGGSASTQVTLTRLGGASADLTLDADGAPGWATITFSPATLAGGTLTSTLTIQTDGDDPTATATSFPLTVTVVGNGLTGSDELTVDVDLLAVAGRLTDTSGQPATGASVVIDGGTPVDVDVNGQFAGPDVAIPYDLVVYDALGTWAHEYQGLTATDLQLISIGTPASPATTTVSGDLGAAVGANQLGVVCVEGIDQVVTGCDEVPVATTAFSINANWFEGTTVAARVRAWVVDVDGDGITTGFAFEGQTPINLSDAVAALVDVALEDAPEAITVDVAITPPPGVPLAGSVLVFHTGEFSTIPFPMGAGIDPVYSAVLPDIPGATASLVALASGPSAMIYSWAQSEYASGELSIVMPPAVTPMAPADAAIDVNTSTEFRVNNPAGSATTFLFTGPSTIAVSSNAAEITFPELAGTGITVPAATVFSWQAVVSANLTTLDELATEGWVSELFDLQTMLEGGPGPEENGALSLGGSRTFTTE